MVSSGYSEDNLLDRSTYPCYAVADVPDPETHLNAHEFLDVAAQPKPVYISPNEVYSMHGLLVQHASSLVSFGEGI